MKPPQTQDMAEAYEKSQTDRKPTPCSTAASSPGLHPFPNNPDQSTPNRLRFLHLEAFFVSLMFSGLLRFLRFKIFLYTYFNYFRPDSTTFDLIRL